MNVFCRGCRSEIDLNASNCNICLRPRDRTEMLEDAKMAREEQAAAKKRPWLILGWSLGLAAVGYAGWTWRQPLSSAVDRVRDKASAMMDSATDPTPYAPVAAMPSTPSSETPPKPDPAPVKPAPASFAPAAAPPPTSAAPAPAALPPVDWTLPAAGSGYSQNAVLVRGFVYDLVTARPVPGARFYLQDRLNAGRIMVSADHRGYFETTVSLENSGLTPIAETPGYRAETLEDDLPPWFTRSAAKRAAAAAKRPPETLLTFTSRQEEAVFNIVLLPR